MEVDLAHIKLENESLKELAEGKLRRSEEERSIIQRRLDRLVQEFRVAEKERFTTLEADMAEYGKFVKDWVIQKIIQKYPHVDISDINFIIPVEEGEMSQGTTEAVATPAATEAVATSATTEAMPEAPLVVAEERRGPNDLVEVEAAIGNVGATVTVEVQTEETTAPTNERDDGPYKRKRRRPLQAAKCQARASLL